MESAITVKGQATIPKPIREHLGLQPGDRVKFFVHPDGSVVLLPKRSASAIRGMVKSRSPRARDHRANDRSSCRRCFESKSAATTPMIGLDTNVLILYLTQDDPVQSAKATAILERRLTPKNPGFVSVVAMVETVWVLDCAYGLTAQEIATAVERLLQVEVLAIENEQEVFTAMVALKQGRGSFADALVAELGARAGCTRTLTFDQKALRLPSFELV